MYDDDGMDPYAETGLDSILDAKSDDPMAMKDYAQRLQQVVLQQHTARREDWAHFHSRESVLLEEVGELRRFAEDREWQRNAERFRVGEERAANAERMAEDSLRRARQELGRRNRDLEKRTAEVELRAEASEAEALATAYRLSGELRSELDTVRGATGGFNGGRDQYYNAPRSPAPQVSQARRALEDIRGVRDRVDGLLQGYPMA